VIELGYDPDDLAWHLRCYGEDELTEKVPKLTDDQLRRIGHVGGGFAMRSDTPSGAGMMLAKALALAAVKVIEGRERPLARARRRPGSLTRGGEPVWPE
jgi:hypothetical protein